MPQNLPGSTKQFLQNLQRVRVSTLNLSWFLNFGTDLRKEGTYNTTAVDVDNEPVLRRSEENRAARILGKKPEEY